MYIFEWLIKYLKNKPHIKQKSFDPPENEPDGLVENPQNCEHLFLPLDSSKEMFACKYCGLVIPKDRFIGE